MTLGIAGSVGSTGSAASGGVSSGSLFAPTYVTGVPQTATLVINAATAQRVALPTGTHVRVKFTGYGPFRYRVGNSTVVALSTDTYADPGDVVVLPVGVATHLSIYGVSYGNAYVEGGAVVLQLNDTILYERNSGYAALAATTETEFATFVIPAGQIAGDFVSKRRMIEETFMAGINFSAATARLTLREYWNGTMVQQITVNPQKTGVQGFGAGQNKVIDIASQMRMESGTAAACFLRGHLGYETVFDAGVAWGDKTEEAYGSNISVDVSAGVTVSWKYIWNGAGNLFYFDHLKVTW